MTPGDIAAGAWAAVIALCLLSIVLFFVIGAWASVRTIAASRGRARRRSDLLAELASGCAVSELAEIDDELQQILEQEKAGKSAWASHDHDHAYLRLAARRPPGARA